MDGLIDDLIIDDCFNTFNYLYKTNSKVKYVLYQIVLILIFT